jgi:hypothetical protein
MTEQTALNKYLELSFHSYAWGQMSLAQQSELHTLATAELATMHEKAERFAEIEDYYKRVVSEQCAPDELHCTCVPALRAELATKDACIVELLEACEKLLAHAYGDTVRGNFLAEAELAIAKAKGEEWALK